MNSWNQRIEEPKSKILQNYMIEKWKIPNLKLQNFKISQLQNYTTKMFIKIWNLKIKKLQN